MNYKMRIFMLNIAPFYPMVEGGSYIIALPNCLYMLGWTR